MRRLSVQCPAKVNLFLEATGRRRDGLHLLSTLFAKINLYDVLELQADESGQIKLEVEGADIGAGEDNLALRAARAFYRTFRIGRGVSIRLTKRIPVGAGLGGGSSDAAGMLLGLPKLFDLELTGPRKRALRRIAAGLGADVPFFLHPAPFCLGTGIGERLKPLAFERSLPYMLLAYPGLHISTAQAYKSLPAAPRRDVLTRLSQLDKLLASLGNGRPVEDWAPLLFNRLEQAGLPELAQVGQARRILERLGVLGARMSGSGSSVFGFVRSHAEGERLLKRLQAYPWKVFLTSCQG
ncbi:MAG: 4-(cytidine 5'-diphospho)-2-C-methyl-D-erythritol kinase [Elusimicrobia bacterium]|nr:4-(cytidine 5'-diphospho)-2-C-methyl-D-erythritol kinase [Elusimicrobiota bacterium]MDE2425095.1 4-(cytidine 5'-diphospho)-2-C-methyl-D-erythritol kinase [Elusimicrobiota bacterium]